MLPSRQTRLHVQGTPFHTYTVVSEVATKGNIVATTL